MDETEMDFTTKTQFVDALLACPTMRDRNTRSQIVDQLTNVRVRIPRSETDHIDVANIVNRTLDFDDGLAQLIDVLRFYEGDSRHMQNVDTLYEQHAIEQGLPASGNSKQQESKPSNVQPATQRPLRLFLCHASGDKVETRNLYERLRLDSMDPWLDEKNLLPGQQWQQEIPQAVHQADVVIVALSHNAINAQRYIHEEIRFALDAADKLPENTIYIIPVKLEECDVPEQLARLQWVNLFEPDGYERLTQALEVRAQEIGAKPPLRKSGAYNYVTQPKPQKSSSWLSRWTIGTFLIILITALGIGLWYNFIPSIGIYSIPSIPIFAPNSTLGIRSTYINPVDGSTYLYVPVGEFTMGSEGENSDENPQHTVYLDSYWIMETEVTNTQYQKFIDAGGYTTEAYWSPDGWSGRDTRTEPGCWGSSNGNGLQQPVICVSWYEAEAYANWLSVKTGLNFSLPTEAQWEKAARGNDGRVYPWGNQWDDSKANSSGNDDGYEHTAPVGSYPAGTSPYGTLDMAGNVWEWTADWYGGNYYQSSPSSNPLGPTKGIGRVLRGGSWINYPNFLRAADRYGYDPDFRNHHVGFRLVRHETAKEN